MSTQTLGLAEHEVKHLKADGLPEGRFVKRIVSEPPNFKLILFNERYWYVPLPWTHYLLLKNPDPRKRTWMLYSVWMSPRHLTQTRFRKVSAPILSNMYNYDPIFRPCQRNGTTYEDINKIIASFWDGRFNEDLRPMLHPVVCEIAGGNIRPFTDPYFQKWETLSIEELLKMRWPQNVRI